MIVVFLVVASRLALSHPGIQNSLLPFEPIDDQSNLETGPATSLLNPELDRLHIRQDSRHIYFLVVMLFLEGDNVILLNGGAPDDLMLLTRRFEEVMAGWIWSLKGLCNPHYASWYHSSNSVVKTQARNENTQALIAFWKMLRLQVIGWGGPRHLMLRAWGFDPYSTMSWVDPHRTSTTIIIPATRRSVDLMFEKLGEKMNADFHRSQQHSDHNGDDVIRLADLVGKLPAEVVKRVVKDKKGLICA